MTNLIIPDTSFVVPEQSSSKLIIPGTELPKESPQPKQEEIQEPVELELVPDDAQELKTKCLPWDFINPPFSLIQFSYDLVKTMRDNNGLGLAANQVGCILRIFAMRGNPNIVCVNPSIVWQSKEQDIMEEGCLTVPNLILEIPRSKHIKMRYTQPNGETVTHTYTGMTARIAQHEIDHLDGIFFSNRVSKIKLERAIKKCNKKFKTNYKLEDLYNPDVCT